MHGIMPQANNTATMFGIAQFLMPLNGIIVFTFPKRWIKKNGTSLPKLIGTHDFIGFSALKKQKSTTRTIEKITIERNGEMLQFTFVGNGFLHKMVRILVGTLLEIGAGTKELAIIDELFATKVREGAGETAPARVVLDEVYYK